MATLEEVRAFCQGQVDKLDVLGPLVMEHNPDTGIMLTGACAAYATVIAVIDGVELTSAQAVMQNLGKESTVDNDAVEA